MHNLIKHTHTGEEGRGGREGKEHVEQRRQGKDPLETQLECEGEPN